MKSLLAAAAFASLAIAPVYANCLYPHAPANLPDGNVATLALMLAAQKTVQTYNHAMMAYLACIKAQSDKTIAEQSLKLSKKQVAALESMEIQRHNAAIDQLKSIASEFNAQVRIYKKKHATKSN
jgi:hypothetical protein